MSQADPILLPEQEQLVKESIAAAEKKTSGEIRVYMEHRCATDVFDRAAFIFEKLEMHTTRQRNGVLIYIASEDRKYAIIGDAGIHAMVKQEFWEQVSSAMTAYFKEGDLVSGIIHAVEKAGNELQQYFPCGDDDKNELSDDIAYGDK